MDNITIDNYNIKFINWFGDYENCITNFEVTNPQGKKTKEKRYITANKKGIIKTSIYGMNIKFNLNDKIFI